MDLHHLEGIIGIKPAVEEVAPGVQLLSIPLLLSIALEQPGIGDHRMLLKCALKRVARRTQQHESRPDGLYLLQLGPLGLALALLDGSHEIKRAGIDS